METGFPYTDLATGETGWVVPIGWDEEYRTIVKGGNRHLAPDLLLSCVDRPGL